MGFLYRSSHRKLPEISLYPPQPIYLSDSTVSVFSVDVEHSYWPRVMHSRCLMNPGDSEYSYPWEQVPEPNASSCSLRGTLAFPAPSHRATGSHSFQSSKERCGHFGSTASRFTETLVFNSDFHRWPLSFILHYFKLCRI